MISYALRSEGFECLWRTTLQEGREAFAAREPDLLLLDVGLPDGSGFELCKEIRRESDAPIVFLTARADEIDRVVGLEIGADDYVVKPFSPRELTARVKAILRRSRSMASGGERVGGAAREPVAHPWLEVDRERREIRFHGQTLPLTRYERRLLEILIARPGRVYTRDELMSSAWDEPDASMDRTVDAHIKSIRAKLRRVDGSADLIKTHRGVGYSLAELPAGSVT